MDHFIRCIECKDLKKVVVDESEFADWQRGMVIQKAMPNLSADERELFVTGICGKCFDAMFPEEDELDIADQTGNDLH